MQCFIVLFDKLYKSICNHFKIKFWIGALESFNPILSDTVEAVSYTHLFLKTSDLQKVIDSSDKNYPTLRKLATLFRQMYKYAISNDLCDKDYSAYIEDVYKRQGLNEVL